VAEANENVGLDTLLSGSDASTSSPATATSGSSSDGLPMEERLKSALVRGTGISTDFGLTLQKRSKSLDVRLGVVARDLGDTRFTGGIPPWRQTLGAGLGLTLHTRDSALHCAADFRDALGAYAEHWTRRVFAGCRAIWARYFGLAAGLHHGYPSGGIVLNLYVVRLEAGTYTREMGRQVGSNPRNVYFVALGSEIP
jgi:hypothetical protein